MLRLVTRAIAIALCVSLLGNEGTYGALPSSRRSMQTATPAPFKSQALELSFVSNRLLRRTIISFAGLLALSSLAAQETKAPDAQIKTPVAQMEQALKMNRPELFLSAIQASGRPQDDLENLLEAQEPAQADAWEGHITMWLEEDAVKPHSAEARDKIRTAVRLLYRVSNNPTHIEASMDTLLKLAIMDANQAHAMDTHQNRALANSIADRLVVDLRRKPDRQDSGEKRTVIHEAELLRNSDELTRQTSVDFLELFLQREGVNISHRIVAIPVAPQPRPKPVKRLNPLMRAWQSGPVAKVLMIIFGLVAVAALVWILHRAAFSNFAFIVLQKDGSEEFWTHVGALTYDYRAFLWGAGAWVLISLSGYGFAFWALGRLRERRETEIFHAVQYMALTFQDEIRTRQLHIIQRSGRLEASSRPLFDFYAITNKLLRPISVALGRLSTVPTERRQELADAQQRLAEIKNFYQMLLGSEPIPRRFSQLKLTGLPLEDRQIAWNLLQGDLASQIRPALHDVLFSVSVHHNILVHNIVQPTRLPPDSESVWTRLHLAFLNWEPDYWMSDLYQWGMRGSGAKKAVACSLALVLAPVFLPVLLGSQNYIEAHDFVWLPATEDPMSRTLLHHASHRNFRILLHMLLWPYRLIAVSFWRRLGLALWYPVTILAGWFYHALFGVAWLLKSRAWVSGRIDLPAVLGCAHAA